MSDDNGGALVGFVYYQVVIGGQLLQSKSLFFGKIVIGGGVLCHFADFQFDCFKGVLEWSGTQYVGGCVCC